MKKILVTLCSSLVIMAGTNCNTCCCMDNKDKSFAITILPETYHNIMSINYQLSVLDADYTSSNWIQKIRDIFESVKRITLTQKTCNIKDIITIYNNIQYILRIPCQEYKDSNNLMTEKQFALLRGIASILQEVLQALTDSYNVRYPNDRILNEPGKKFNPFG